MISHLFGSVKYIKLIKIGFWVIFGILGFITLCVIFLTGLYLALKLVKSNFEENVNSDREEYIYKITRVDLINNITSRNFGYLGKKLEMDEVVSYSDDSDSKYTLISNLGTEEYYCQIVCSCVIEEEEDYRRGKGKILKVLKYIFVVGLVGFGLYKTSQDDQDDYFNYMKNNVIHAERECRNDPFGRECQRNGGETLGEIYECESVDEIHGQKQQQQTTNVQQTEQQQQPTKSHLNYKFQCETNLHCKTTEASSVETVGKVIVKQTKDQQQQGGETEEEEEEEELEPSLVCTDVMKRMVLSFEETWKIDENVKSLHERLRKNSQFDREFCEREQCLADKYSYLCKSKVMGSFSGYFPIN